MNVVNIYLALASAAGLCLVHHGASTESLSSYTKLTKAAIRVAKRLCHTALYKESKLCKDFQEAVNGFQTELLSLYNNDKNTINGTGTGNNKDNKSGNNNGNNSGNNNGNNSGNNNGNNSGNNKDSNSGTDKNNSDDDSSKAGYFGNPGISYGG